MGSGKSISLISPVTGCGKGACSIFRQIGGKNLIKPQGLSQLTNSLRRSGLSTAILSSPLVPPLALRYLDFLRALIQGIVGVLRFLLQ